MFIIFATKNDFLGGEALFDKIYINLYMASNNNAPCIVNNLDIYKMPPPLCLPYTLPSSELNLISISPALTMSVFLTMLFILQQMYTAGSVHQQNDNLLSQ